MTTPPSPPASIAGAVLSAGNAIGRYFNIVSAVPAALLVLWTYALVVSQSGHGRPRLHDLPAAFEPTVGRALALILAVVFVGLFLHPLQFGMVRLLEGYWGSSGIGCALASTRVNRYRRRKRQVLERKAHATERLLLRVAATDPGLAVRPTSNDEEAERWEDDVRARLDEKLESATGDTFVHDVLVEQEAIRQYDDFPDDHRILPTRLGNALRNMEDTAGSQYGLALIPIAPHLVLSADQREVARVEDAGQGMDVAVRLVLVSILATVEAAAFLLTDGPWLLVALAPYALAYISYRGAVSAARNYGAAMSALVDLNRFALYDRLHVPRPRDLGSEVEQNDDLMRMLVGDSANVRYRFDPGSGLPPFSVRRSM